MFKSFKEFLLEFSYKEIDRDKLKEDLWEKIQELISDWKGSGTSFKAQGTDGGIVVYFSGKVNYSIASGDINSLETSIGKKYKELGGNFVIKKSDFDKENNMGWITILIK